MQAEGELDMVQKENGSITLLAVGDVKLAGKDYNLGLVKVAVIIKSAAIAFFSKRARTPRSAPTTH